MLQTIDSRNDDDLAAWRISAQAKMDMRKDENSQNGRGMMKYDEEKERQAICCIPAGGADGGLCLRFARRSGFQRDSRQAFAHGGQQYEL